MIFIWIFYYFALTSLCYFFIKINKNKFIKFFFTPIIFGIFGSIWFLKPGSSELAPIISIIFLESSIIEPNGLNRLLRPMVSYIFLSEIISLIIYLNLKRNNF